MKAIEVGTTIEQEDVKKMLITAMFFRSPLLLPLLLLVTFGFSYVSWSYQKMSGIWSLLILWLGFLLVVVFVLVRKSLQRSRNGGGLDFVGKEQSYRFGEKSFDYRPGPGRKYITLPYERIRHFSAMGDFLIVYIDKNAALVLRKKDMNPDELKAITALLRNKGTK